MTRPKSAAANRITIALLILVMWLAFGLRLHQLAAQSLWYDELLQLDVAQRPLAQLLPELNRHAAMPLDYVLLQGWIKLGRQDFWVRWPAVIFGSLAVALLYAVGQAFFNRRVGLLAALLLSVASFAIDYSQEVRPYALLLSLVLLAFWGLRRVYQTHRLRDWLPAAIGIIGAVMAHYFGLFILLPLGLFVGVQQLRHLKQARYWQHTACFALCLLVLLVGLVLLGRFKPLYNVSFGVTSALQQPEVLTSPAVEKPNRGSGPPLKLDFFVDRVFGPLAAGSALGLLSYSLFGLVAILSLLKRRSSDRAALLLLLGWLLLPILSIYFFLIYRGTFYAVRYILYTLPAYLLLVAYGLDRTAGGLTYFFSNGSRRSLPGLLPSGLVILLLPLLAAEQAELRRHYSAEAYEDWRAVAQLLQAHAEPNDAIIAVKAEPTLNWYYPPATASFGAYSRSQPIWQAINRHPRRWFILSSYSKGRDVGLRDWLQENEAVTIAIDRRVVVYLQQEGKSAQDLLNEVKNYSLPPKALTYAMLARQLSQHGALVESRQFSQKAFELVNPTDRALVETLVATGSSGKPD